MAGSTVFKVIILRGCFEPQLNYGCLNGVQSGHIAGMLRSPAQFRPSRNTPAEPHSGWLVGRGSKSAFCEYGVERKTDGFEAAGFLENLGGSKLVQIDLGGHGVGGHGTGGLEAHRGFMFV